MILTNANDFELSGMNNYIDKLLQPIFNKKAVTALKKYVGTYVLGGGYDSLTIYIKNDSLHSTYLQDLFKESPLVTAGNNKFKTSSKGNCNVGYDFVKNGKNEIEFLNLGQLLWVKKQ